MVPWHEVPDRAPTRRTRPPPVPCASEPRAVATGRLRPLRTPRARLFCHRARSTPRGRFQSSTARRRRSRARRRRTDATTDAATGRCSALRLRLLLQTASRARPKTPMTPTRVSRRSLRKTEALLLLLLPRRRTPQPLSRRSAGTSCAEARRARSSSPRSRRTRASASAVGCLSPRPRPGEASPRGTASFHPDAAGASAAAALNPTAPRVGVAPPRRRRAPRRLPQTRSRRCFALRTA
mmetsp:Transcript_6159/g.24948  ORF Transcript_6159/g.24948 Transcript_6159/m.24948 type:complete len:238 (+) Transcript_6159:78-791(+)